MLPARAPDHSNLKGQTFGEWTVVRDLESGDGSRKVLAQCSCGLRRMVRASSLRAGLSTFCNRPTRHREKK